MRLLKTKFEQFEPPEEKRHDYNNIKTVIDCIDELDEDYTLEEIADLNKRINTIINETYVKICTVCDFPLTEDDVDSIEALDADDTPYKIAYEIHEKCEQV